VPRGRSEHSLPRNGHSPLLLTQMLCAWACESQQDQPLRSTDLVLAYEDDTSKTWGASRSFSLTRERIPQNDDKCDDLAVIWDLKATPYESGVFSSLFASRTKQKCLCFGNKYSWYRCKRCPIWCSVPTVRILSSEVILIEQVNIKVNHQAQNVRKIRSIANEAWIRD